ncbi:hypothetical protein V6N13_059717 [Hibiscus sabdariffa]
MLEERSIRIPEDLQRKGRLGITPENLQSLMGYDEAATAKQPTSGPKTIVVARLAALTTMVETTRAQLEELKTDLRTYFKYVQERDQVIRANFNEMLPQSPLDFPHFPQDLMKPAAAKMSDAQPTQNEPVEHTPNPPQDKPLGSDSASSSPIPPIHTPQTRSPPAQTNKGKAPRQTPPAPSVEVDSEDTIAMEAEDIESIPQPQLSPTSVKRRSVKRTAGRILAEKDKPSPVTLRSEEEVQSRLLRRRSPQSYRLPIRRASSTRPPKEPDARPPSKVPIY